MLHAWEMSVRLLHFVAMVARFVCTRTQACEQRLARDEPEDFWQFESYKEYRCVPTWNVLARPGGELCESGSRISIFEGGLLGFVVISPRVLTCMHVHGHVVGQSALVFECYLNIYMQFCLTW